MARVFARLSGYEPPQPTRPVFFICKGFSEKTHQHGENVVVRPLRKATAATCATPVLRALTFLSGVGREAEKGLNADNRFDSAQVPIGSETKR